MIYVRVSVFSFFFCYHHLISGEVCISCLVLACIICTRVFWSDHVSRARSTVGPQNKLFDRRDLTSPLLCTIVCFSLKSLLNRSEMISWREGQPKKSWKKLWSDVEATKVPLRSVLQSTLWWWPPLSSHHLFILASCLWEPPPSQYTAAQHCSIPLLSTYKWNLFYLMFSTEFPSSFLHFLLLVVLLCLSPAVVSLTYGVGCYVGRETHPSCSLLLLAVAACTIFVAHHRQCDDDNDGDLFVSVPIECSVEISNPSWLNFACPEISGGVCVCVCAIALN